MCIRDRGTAAFLNAHGVTTEAVYWPDERPDAENNVMTMIADHAFDLIVNIPTNHTKRELTNGYKIRRGAIDHNIPLLSLIHIYLRSSTVAVERTSPVSCR